MANIEFECTECGNKFTMQRLMADRDSEVKCPKCGTKHPRRVLKSLKSKLLYFFSPGAGEGSGVSGSSGGC